jgi:peptidyl-tRNA hydrolase
MLEHDEIKIEVAVLKQRMDTSERDHNALAATMKELADNVRELASVVSQQKPIMSLIQCGAAAAVAALVTWVITKR